MMQEIKRYDLKYASTWDIMLPEESRVVKVGEVGGKPCMWIVSSTESKNRKLELWHCSLAIDGEQEQVLSGYRYIGTYVMGNGTFVAHLFMKKEIG